MRKAKWIFFLACLTYSYSAFPDQMKGYYVDLKGDTTYVIFDIPLYLNSPNYHMIQNEIKYFDSNGKKVKLKSRITTTYCFLFNDSLIKMVAYNGPMVLAKFLKLQVDGELKLYIFYSPSSSNPLSLLLLKEPLLENYLYQKRNEKFLAINTLNFRNQMSGYLSEFPDLVAKINSKIYKVKDIEKITLEYNAHFL